MARHAPRGPGVFVVNFTSPGASRDEARLSGGIEAVFGLLGRDVPVNNEVQSNDNFVGADLRVRPQGAQYQYDAMR